MNDYELKHKFQGSDYWIEVWEKGSDRKIVIGTFDGTNMFVSNRHDERVRLVVSIMPMQDKS